jgi:hypothetical protein
MDREAFFEWLNTCPTKWNVVLDDFGNTTIRFEYVELEDLEEVTNAN